MAAVGERVGRAPGAGGVHILRGSSKERCRRAAGAPDGSGSIPPARCVPAVRRRRASPLPADGGVPRV
ncbi:hypothetical protein [Streptomyces clavuligerus]|uniref:hypothetical protein n=1 Tax=Streptomyces clavuligerus TaxID=1901 RepID=UPI003556F779